MKRPNDAGLTKLIRELHDETPQERVVFVSKSNKVLSEIHPAGFSGISNTREYLCQKGTLKAMVHIAAKSTGPTRTTYVSYRATGDVFTFEWSPPVKSKSQWIDQPEPSSREEIQRFLWQGEEESDS